jgi:transcriptional regulator with XRE-family HTH domain
MVKLNEETNAHIRNYLNDRVLSTRTQVEVSEATGMSQSSVSSFSNGKTGVSMAFVLGLSRMTGDPVSRIIGVEYDPPPPTLGQVPGYLEAEKAVRVHLMSDEDAEFWLCVRDTRFAKPLSSMNSELLLRLASFARDAWRESKK